MLPQGTKNKTKTLKNLKMKLKSVSQVMDQDLLLKLPLYQQDFFFEPHQRQKILLFSPLFRPPIYQLDFASTFFYHFPEWHQRLKIKNAGSVSVVWIV